MALQLTDVRMLVITMAKMLGLRVVGDGVTRIATQDGYETRFVTETPIVTTYLSGKQLDGVIQPHGHGIAAVDLDQAQMAVVQSYVNESAARVRGATIRQWLLDDRAVRFDTATTDEQAFADFEAFDKMSTVLMEHMAAAEKRWKGTR